MGIGWAAMAMSIAGNVLVVKKRAGGFAVWTLGNAIWIALAAARRDWAQVALFVAYSALNLWGLVEWRKRTEEGPGGQEKPGRWRMDLVTLDEVLICLARAGYIATVHDEENEIDIRVARRAKG